MRFGLFSNIRQDHRMELRYTLLTTLGYKLIQKGGTMKAATSLLNKRWDHRIHAVAVITIIATYVFGFTIEPQAQNNDQIRNRASGRCLDADTDTINSNSTRVQLYDCWGGQNQQWSLEMVSRTCAHCNDGSCQCGPGTPDELCANNGGNDPTIGCNQIP